MAFVPLLFPPGFATSELHELAWYMGRAASMLKQPSVYQVKYHTSQYTLAPSPVRPEAGALFALNNNTYGMRVVQDCTAPLFLVNRFVIRVGRVFFYDWF